MNKILNINDLSIIVKMFNNLDNYEEFEEVLNDFLYSDNFYNIIKEFFINLKLIDDKIIVPLKLLTNKIEKEFEDIDNNYLIEFLNIFINIIQKNENINNSILNKIFEILWIIILKNQKIDLIKNIILIVKNKKFWFWNSAVKILNYNFIIIEKKRILDYKLFLINNLSYSVFELINNELNKESLECFEKWIKLFMDEDKIDFLRNSKLIIFIIDNLTNENYYKNNLKILFNYIKIIRDEKYKIQIYGIFYNKTTTLENNLHSNINNNEIFIKNNIIKKILKLWLKLLIFDQKLFFNDINIFINIYSFIIRNINLINKFNKRVFYDLEIIYNIIKTNQINNNDSIKNILRDSVYKIIPFFKIDMYLLEKNENHSYINELYEELELRENFKLFIISFCDCIGIKLLLDGIKNYLSKINLNEIINLENINEKILFFESIIFIILTCLNDYNKFNYNVLIEEDLIFIKELTKFIFKLKVKEEFIVLTIIEYFLSTISFIKEENYNLLIHEFVIKLNDNNSKRIEHLKFQMIFRLCNFYPKLFQKFKEFYFNILLNNIYNIFILKSLMLIFEIEKSENKNNFIIKLCSIYAKNLLEIKNNNNNLNCNIENEINKNLKYIIIIIKKIKKTDYLLNIVNEIWPLLNYFLNIYYKIEDINEKICKFFNIIIKNIKGLSIDLINSYYSVIINNYEKLPLGCYLYSIETFYKLFHGDEFYYELFNQIYNKINVLTLNFYTKSNNIFYNDPFLFEDFFGYQSTSIKYLKNIFFKNENLIHLLKLYNELILKGNLIYKVSFFMFYIRFLNYYLQMKKEQNIINIPIENEILFQIILNFIQLLLKGGLKEKYIQYLIEIFLFYFEYIENFNEWFIKIIFNFNENILNKNEKENIINFLSKNKFLNNNEKYLNIVDNFLNNISDFN